MTLDVRARLVHTDYVPNAPRTPQRTIRICDEDWLEAQHIAKDRGENVSAVLRAALERYVKRNEKKMAARRKATGPA